MVSALYGEYGETEINGVISGAIMAHLTKLGISIDAAALGNPGLEALEGLQTLDRLRAAHFEPSS